MKKIAAVLFLSAAALPSAFAADVGVSVQISQPGVYGRVDIGRFPQPQVVVAQPVIIQRPVAVVRPEPVYMWVPPGHRKNWRKHCGQYNACGVPVYFVRDDWYDQRGPGHERHHDDHDRDRDNGRDHGKDHGKGHGKH